MRTDSMAITMTTTTTICRFEHRGRDRSRSRDRSTAQSTGVIDRRNLKSWFFAILPLC